MEGRKDGKERKGKGKDAFKWDRDSGGGPVGISRPAKADGMGQAVVAEQGLFPAFLFSFPGF